MESSDKPIQAVIEIPGQLMDLNTFINANRSNRYAGARIKNEETERVAWCAKQQVSWKIKLPVFIDIDWYCPNTRKDLDNIAFAKKFIFDGLVMAGVLPNDGWKEISGFSDHFVVHKYPKVVVFLR